MKPRLVPVLVSLPLAAALVGCSAGAPATAPGAKGPAPASPAAAASAEAHTPAKTVWTAPTAPAPTATPATTSGGEGNVEGPGTPDFSVEPTGSQTIKVTLADATARAWRVTVRGTGDRSGDSWTLEVETGDVAPAITTTDTEAGVEGDAVEQEALETGATAGRVCSSVLPVCVFAVSIGLPADGNGTLVLDLARTDPAVPLAVDAATAGWPGEPFNLGPWATTEAFPWDAGAFGA